MKILALETSGQSGSVAVAYEGEIVCEAALPTGMRSAQGLAPTIADVLKRVNWQASDLQIVAVTRGPGSFTGLRVGVTTAKVMAFCLGAKVIGVDTLATIAQHAPSGRSRIWTVLDALRDQFYVASFAPDSAGQYQRLTETRLSGRLQWLEQLDTTSDDYVIGPGVVKLVPYLPAKFEIAPISLGEPQASAVAKFAWKSHLSGNYGEPWTLVPDYFRPSYAEEPRTQR